jgi:hypothetical protein
VSYPVRLSDAARRDVEQLPDRETKLAALRAALALGENPHLGTPLRNRLGTGDLSHCRRLSFDRDDWTGKPRYRLVYYNDPDDGAIAVVRVISVGLRERLAAYRAAAARLRSERRRRFRRT